MDLHHAEFVLRVADVHEALQEGRGIPDATWDVFRVLGYSKHEDPSLSDFRRRAKEYLDKIPEAVRVVLHALYVYVKAGNAAAYNGSKGWQMDPSIRRALGIGPKDLISEERIHQAVIAYVEGAKPEYPEHAKFRAVEAQWNACRDFALWLEQEFANIEFPSPVDEYLSEYFGIDLKKLSAEKDAMAEALAQSAARTPRR